MSYDRRDNSGALFINGKYTPGSKQPNRRGEAKIGGTMYVIAGWNKTGQGGTDYISLAFQTKADADKAREAVTAKKEPTQPAKTETLDDDIPF